jgi:hypothetical protein
MMRWTYNMAAMDDARRWRRRRRRRRRSLSRKAFFCRCALNKSK